MRLEAGDAAAADEVVAVHRAAAGADLGGEARLVAVQVLDGAGAAEAEHRLGGAGRRAGGEHVLGLPEQLLRRQLAGEAGEVDADAGQLDAGQAGDLCGDRGGVLGEDAFAAVAEVDGQEDLDGGAGGVLAEHAGGARVAEQDAVGDLRRRLELVVLRRADQRARAEAGGGELLQRRQAAVGEAGAAAGEHGLADERLAVHALGDADEGDAVAEQPGGEPPGGLGHRVQVDRQSGAGAVMASSLWRAGRSRPEVVRGDRVKVLHLASVPFRQGRVQSPGVTGPRRGDAGDDAGPRAFTVVQARGRRRGEGLKVVEAAAGEGGAAAIVGPESALGTRVSRVWDQARAVYFRRSQPHKWGSTWRSATSI